MMIVCAIETSEQWFFFNKTIAFAFRFSLFARSSQWQASKKIVKKIDKIWGYRFTNSVLLDTTYQTANGENEKQNVLLRSPIPLFARPSQWQASKKIVKSAIVTSGGTGLRIAYYCVIPHGINELCNGKL